MTQPLDNFEWNTFWAAVTAVGTVLLAIITYYIYARPQETSGRPNASTKRRSHKTNILPTIAHRVLDPPHIDESASTASHVSQHITDEVQTVAILRLQNELIEDSLAPRNPFADSRRIMTTVARLQKLIQQSISSHPRTSFPAIIRYQDLVESFITASNRCLPLPDAKAPSKDYSACYEAHMKPVLYDLRLEWTKLDPVLDQTFLTAPDNHAAFHHIVNDKYGAILRLVGFPNAAAFREYVSPTLSSIIKTADAHHLLLLHRLLQNEGGVRIEDLNSEGFPKGVTLDVINALILDKYIQEEGETFELTATGRTIVNAALASYESAPQR